MESLSHSQPAALLLHSTFVLLLCTHARPANELPYPNSASFLSSRTALLACLCRPQQHCIAPPFSPLPVLSPAALCSLSPTHTPSTRATRPNDQLHPRPLSHPLTLSLSRDPSAVFHLHPLTACRSFLLPNCCPAAAFVVDRRPKLFFHPSLPLYRPRRRRPTRATALRRRSFDFVNRRTHSPPTEHRASGDPPPSAALIRDTVPVVCLLAVAVCSQLCHTLSSRDNSDCRHLLLPYCGQARKRKLHPNPAPSLHGA